jgi:acetyl-CoA synthetase
MLETWSTCTEAELRREFAWKVQERYNIGTDCSDRHPATRLAMIHVDHNGRPQELTFGDLTRGSNRLANALRARGIGAGDRVCVALPQHPALAISHIAIYKLGAIAVPVTTQFGPDALRYRLRDSGSALMITDGDTAEKLSSIRAELPDLREVIDVERHWDELLASASSQFSAHPTRADDPAFLIYTSGTTGDPKGALHAHRSLLGHLPGFELSHNFFGQPDDRFWTPADWAWIGGLYDALFPVLQHGKCILSFAAGGKFDPERALTMMARYGVRNAFIPPTALKMLRQHGSAAMYRDVSLRTIMSGGESLGEEMLAWTRESFGVTVNEIYGQTEANYVIGNCHVLYDVRPGSMGKAYAGHEVTVLDQEGRRTSELGEVAIRRPDPVMFLGYWNRQEETSASYPGEWLRTGDMAQLDDDGYFWFKGRSDDVINSAGYRIGPTEIEDCIIRHPSVAMAAVVGVPDDVRGQAIKAFVVLRPGWTEGQDLRAQIQDLVRTRLAAYQYPREVQFVSELPLTTTGKIRRSELRQQNLK